MVRTNPSIIRKCRLQAEFFLVADYSDWYGLDQASALSLSLSSDPVLADREDDWTYPWNNDILVPNFENGFGNPEFLGVGADPAQLDSNYYFDSPAYPMSYDGAFLTANAQDLPLTNDIPVSLCLAPNSDIPSGNLVLASDASASQSGDSGDSAFSRSAESQASVGVSDSQGGQTHMNSEEITNANDVEDYQK
jgi:hypothetical protein